MIENKKLKIYFADLTYVHQGLQSEIVPYSVGCLAAYTKKKMGDKVDISIFKKPDQLIQGLDKEPHIVAFSNYVWNFNISREFARAIKKVYPNVITVFGGPNYPVEDNEQISFLFDQDHADFFIVKEGEKAFYNLASALYEKNFDLNEEYAIPSVHYIDRKTQTPVRNEIETRIEDLSEIPSPYLMNMMDEYLDDGFMPIIQTNRGCPFACTFCVEGDFYYQKIKRSTQEKIKAELEYIAMHVQQRVKQGGRADLFIADSNFGMYQQDVDTATSIQLCQDKFNWPQYIHVTTGKNNKERVLDVAKMVRGALRLSGSVQSLDKDVLKKIKRSNVDSEQLAMLAVEGTELGANTCSEVILGLPGDSRKAYEDSISRLLEFGFNNVETWTLMLLHGSEMSNSETRKKYDFFTRFRVIPRCFGYWTFKGTTISTGEVEEVVVGTNTLSFEEYVHCRRLALLITLFHNDQVFELPIRLLKSLKIPVMECIHAIHEKGHNTGLSEIYSSFSEETENELWNSREELEQYLLKTENIDRFISGELGSNLLFKYKAISFLKEVDVLVDIFSKALKDAIERKYGVLNSMQLEFIKEICLFSGCRVKNLFGNPSEAISIDMSFDFERVITENSFLSMDSKPDSATSKCYHFGLDDQQQSAIKRLINTYGASTTGLTRALTRANVRSLLRHFSPA